MNFAGFVQMQQTQRAESKQDLEEKKSSVFKVYVCDNHM